MFFLLLAEIQLKCSFPEKTCEKHEKILITSEYKPQSMGAMATRSGLFSFNYWQKVVIVSGAYGGALQSIFQFMYSQKSLAKPHS
jgi:hypothetical protein